MKKKKRFGGRTDEGCMEARRGAWGQTDERKNEKNAYIDVKYIYFIEIERQENKNGQK